MSDNSSDDDLELFTIKLKKFIKQESKVKNKLKKKRLLKKKKTLKVTWETSSTSEDKEQTNKDKVVNYALVALDNEVNDSSETPLLYYEIT